MKTLQNLTHYPDLLLYVARIQWRSVASVCFGFILAAIVWHTAAFLWPNSQRYSYASDNCIRKTTLLPSLHKIERSETFSARFSDMKHLGSLPISAGSICLTPTKIPAQNATESLAVKPLGNTIFKHVSRITTPAYPAISGTPSEAMGDVISTRDNLKLTINSADTTFTYHVSAGGKMGPCTTKAQQLECDVEPLGLAQAQSYELSLQRTFKQQPVDTLLTSTVQTVTPLAVTGSSIASNSTVYDAPAAITITFDKPLASYQGITLKTVYGTETAFTTTHTENTLTLSLANPLERNAAYELIIQEAGATDKGFLTHPFTLAFTTSGGPKVIGKNIAASGVSRSANIVLIFDAAIKPEQVSQYFQLHGNGGQIPAAVTLRGSTVTLTPSRNFETCEAFTVKVLDGIQNTYGITDGSTWQHTSRASCYTTFSIGTSVEGRAIVAYKFGSGSSSILYVGGTHGSEPSSKYILDSWIQHLESAAPSLPANRSIIIIPTINPDGLAKNMRTNARGVDLNRNFPANNWKADVTMPGGNLVIKGGGTSPLSEPESAALAAYTLSLKPRLVLTYHAKGSLVTANESGDSLSLAKSYGQKAGYWAIAESQLGATFNYDTTGAFENWLHDKAGMPTLLIELPGYTSNYFTSNRSAMWYTAGI